MNKEEKFLTLLLMVLFGAFVYAQHKRQQAMNQWAKDHPENIRMYDAGDMRSYHK